MTMKERRRPPFSRLSHSGVQDKWLLNLLSRPRLGLGRPHQSEAANAYRERFTAAPVFGHQGKPPLPINRHESQI